MSLGSFLKPTSKKIAIFLGLGGLYFCLGLFAAFDCFDACDANSFGYKYGQLIFPNINLPGASYVSVPLPLIELIIHVVSIYLMSSLLVFLINKRRLK